MPTILSDPGAMPQGLHDDDPTVGMGFSILITVCSLIGLLFCFRRASTLLPRNLNIQLQMFGQNTGNRNSSRNDSPGRRGPIALSDDDLVGATGIDWEDLEAQLREDDEVEGEEENEEEMDDMASTRPLKPITREYRYADDNDDEVDGDEDAGQEMSRGFNVRYRDDEVFDGDSDEDETRGTTNATGARTGTDTQGREGAQKDSLFKLEDPDSEQDA